MRRTSQVTSDSVVSMIIHHLIHGWRLVICVWSSLTSQEFFSNRPCCATNEYDVPTTSSRHLNTLTEYLWDITRFNSGQSSQEPHYSAAISLLIFVFVTHDNESLMEYEGYTTLNLEMFALIVFSSPVSYDPCRHHHGKLQSDRSTNRPKSRLQHDAKSTNKKKKSLSTLWQIQTHKWPVQKQN